MLVKYDPVRANEAADASSVPLTMILVDELNGLASSVTVFLVAKLAVPFTVSD
jgi:hypothetical protein